MPRVRRLDYVKTTSAEINNPEPISETIGTGIVSRAFIVQNQGDVDLMVGNMRVPVGAERAYVDIEGGAGDAEWNSEQILVSSSEANHSYAVEHFEFVE